MSRRRIEYKTDTQILQMRQAGIVVAEIHQALRAAVKPGVTTNDMDQVAAEVISSHNAESNFLGYYGYPKHICASVNDQIVHGIPGNRVLEAGDLVSFDCGAVVEGWHGDACFSVVVGSAEDANPADLEIIRVTEEAMWAGIAALATAKYVVEIGTAIEDVVLAQPIEYGIVEEYTGHGIGTAMHQAPDVYNFATRDRGAKIKEGMVLCIEPMLTRGSAQTSLQPDGWTVTTADGSRAAHVEHEVAIHKRGIWVLTAPDGGEAGIRPFGITPVPPQG